LRRLGSRNLFRCTVERGGIRFGERSCEPKQSGRCVDQAELVPTISDL
jgi:hypothetical protein